MKNFKTILAGALMFLVGTPPASALNLTFHGSSGADIITHTSHRPAGLLPRTPASVKTAGVHWLPDYLGTNADKNTSSQKDDDNRNKPGCENYGYLAFCPTPKTGTAVKPYADLTCYKDCSCPQQYKFASCEAEYKPDGASCDGLYEKCSPRPCSDGGYLELRDSSKICQTAVFGGRNCYSCRDYTCADGNLAAKDGTNAETICSVKNYHNQRCFECRAKTCAEKCSGFKENVSCAKGQTVAVCSSACGTFGKCEGTPCPVSKQCDYGCKSYSTQKDCGDFCVECKPKPLCTATAVGHILFADKTTCNAVVEGKTPIGVVVDPAQKLAVGLLQGGTTWSTTDFDIPTITNLTSETAVRNNTNAKSITKAYVDYCSSNGKSCKAATFAKSFVTEGTKNGDWYLPSASMMQKVCANLAKINKGVETINASGFHMWGIEGTGYPPQYRYPAYYIGDTESYLLAAEKSSAEIWVYRCKNSFKKPAVTNDIETADKKVNDYRNNAMIRVFYNY